MKTYIARISGKIYTVDFDGHYSCVTVHCENGNECYYAIDEFMMFDNVELIQMVKEL